MNQQDMSQTNRLAWEAKAYEAWVQAFGPPAQAAEKLRADPRHKVRRLLPHLGEVKGTTIANPLGSNGRLAVALALLGADVTVFDISESNRRYAVELAACAGTKINYVVTDFLKLPVGQYADGFDAVAMELGILHYFLDLEPLIGVLYRIVKEDGRVVINDCHPLTKKAISVAGGTIKLMGDYFSTAVETGEVAYQSLLKSAGELPPCLLRRWTLGEIVTAFARSPFRIELLEELPGWELTSLPCMFTLVVRR